MPLQGVRDGRPSHRVPTPPPTVLRGAPAVITVGKHELAAPPVVGPDPRPGSGATATRTRLVAPGPGGQCAASNASGTAAGIRPRSDTEKPWVRAQARTAGPCPRPTPCEPRCDGEGSALWAAARMGERRARPPVRRAWVTQVDRSSREWRREPRSGRSRSWCRPGRSDGLLRGHGAVEVVDERDGALLGHGRVIPFSGVARRRPPTSVWAAPGPSPWS